VFPLFTISVEFFKLYREEMITLIISKVIFHEKYNLKEIHRWKEGEVWIILV
jgi:hypothetical protein